ncbi:MAG TPA: hypothetical protein VLC73_16675, partial [Burkholderiales bacterium]|nr:hypothetical protein [Burkholderiales bacterium]
MLARRPFVVGFVQLATFVLVLVLGLTGCASSMVSSKEELQSLGDNEGIVIGSFVINVEKGEQDESGWAFLKGRKAGGFDYGVTITERLTSATAEAVNVLIPTKTSYGFEVKPEQEFRFVKKLPAGTYQVGEVRQLGFSNLYVILAVNFTVRPKQTTYIGRLTVQFPNRVAMLSQVTAKVTDAQEE